MDKKSKPTYAEKRIFNGKTFFTDFREYPSKYEARLVVYYLKTKDVSVRARIIDKKGFAVIYWDENTFNKIKYAIIPIPDYEEIPEDIKKMVEKRFGYKSKGQTCSDVDLPSNISRLPRWRQLQLLKFQKNKKDQFQIINLEKDVSNIELLKKTIDEDIEKNEKKISNDQAQKEEEKITKKTEKEITDENEEDEIEEGISTTFTHIENEFFKSCPKCGGDMKPNFLIVGINMRISVFQCKDCKFYIPRRI
ncbi:MAG: hypothetical protein ACTSRZ_00555 [Promethearchaeota archaeon]